MKPKIYFVSKTQALLVDTIISICDVSIIIAIAKVIILAASSASLISFKVASDVVSDL